MDVKIERSWKDRLTDEFNKKYFLDLVEFVKEQYSKGKVYPPPSKIFSAFEFCSFDDVKVVIVGQDPYHGPKQANGLAFSVSDDVRVPPSLQNIYKELKSDLGITAPSTGNLEKWAKQGVLLLNATLTVQANNPGSHQNIGWEIFTDSIIDLLSKEKENIVFILWGAYAQKKGEVIDSKKHLVIKSAHPSPFAANRGFFGSKPFSKTNEYLRENGKEEIMW